MKISKILAGMSAAAIVASMAMIPASAAGTKLNVSDDLLAIGRQSQDDLFAIFFRGDESEGNVVKDGITDITAVYGASFTIKVDNNDWNTIGGADFLAELKSGQAVLYATFEGQDVGAALAVNVDGDGKSYIIIDYTNLRIFREREEQTLDAL